MIHDVELYASMINLMREKKEGKEFANGVEVGFYFSKIWLPLNKLPKEGEVVLVKNRRGVVHLSHFQDDHFRGLPYFFRVESWRSLERSSEDISLDLEACEVAIEISKLITDPILAIEEGYKRGKRDGQNN